MKRWMITAVASIGLLSLPVLNAQAAFIIPWVGDFVTPASGGSVTLSNTNGLDLHSSGFGMTDNFPAVDVTTITPMQVAGLIGQTFDFYYQSTIVAVNNDNGDDITPTNYNSVTDGTGSIAAGDFQLTAVAKFTEVITGAQLVFGNVSLEFAPVVNAFNEFSLYYDDNSLAGTTSDQEDGTDMTDGGTKILGGQVVSGDSQFQLTSATAGFGSLTDGLLIDIGFVDTNFFQGPPLINALVTGNIEIPHPFSTTTPASATPWTGDPTITHDPTSGDVVLRIDGESRLGTVPEPGTMILLGSGLLGVAGAARRRKKA